MAIAESSLGKIIRANIIATHAFEIGLARKSGKGEAACWADQGLSPEQLQQLVAHQGSLLDEDPEAVKAWAQGKSSKFDPAKDVQKLLDAPLKVDRPRLPVNVFGAYFQRHGQAGGEQAASLASVMQMMLEVDRDGDVLQKLFMFYLHLGLPIYPGQVGLPTDDEPFAAMGKEIAPAICPSPFDTDARTIHMMFRKMTNWGMRFTGKRDKHTVAGELLDEPDVRAMLAKIQAMSAEKIATIGHSFTMNMHWASASAFVPIVGAMLEKANPKVTIRQWEGGGLTASRALKNHYQDALAWKPARVFMVLGLRNEDDVKALDTMVGGFTGAGAGVFMFDGLAEPWIGRPADIQELPDRRRRMDQMVDKHGMTIVEVGQILSSAPDRDTFLAMDGIHMTEPYHRLMAKQWLAFLCGARTARL